MADIEDQPAKEVDNAKQEDDEDESSEEELGNVICIHLILTATNITFEIE